jgi:hypothetical protein
MKGLSFESLLGHTLTFGPDRYRLQKVLGGGATAVVFLGVDPGEPERRERQVAVKVARPGSGATCVPWPRRKKEPALITSRAPSTRPPRMSYGRRYI